ncbi:RNA-directed DNA polymerase, eukaryota, reverse transcriptase zinc-binding domain protein [Tanacetum coccineum]
MGRNTNREFTGCDKFSKLDRFLITGDFQEIWRNLGSVALDRKLSDHYPIVLLDKGLDFGPKPFRFFDAWLKYVEMIDVVKEAWGAPVSTITPDCVFWDKLKNVKHALKEWSKKKYGGLEQEIDSSRKEVVDFEKAYDCVNWEFLEDIMQQMGFGRKWCGWIRACLELATSLVLVNGSPTEEFALERGIRQGDPLLPFLFLIVAESLNVAMQEVFQGGLFDGVKVGSDGIEVSHLQYADDTIFVGD